MNAPPRSADPQAPRYIPRPPGPPRPRPPGSSRPRPSSGGGGFLLVFFLLLAAGACGGYYYITGRKPVKDTVVVTLKPAAGVQVTPGPVMVKEEPKVTAPAPVPPPVAKPLPEVAAMPRKVEPATPPQQPAAADEAKLATLFAGVLPLDERAWATPAVQQQAKAAQEAALTQDKWTEWQSLLRRSLLAAVKKAGASSVTPQGLTALAANPVFSRVLDQSAFLATVPPAALSAVSKQEVKRSFYNWLMSSPAPLESWLLTVRPSDDTAKALDQWSQLAQEDPTARDKYCSLAIACALVFKKPLTFKWNEQDLTVTAAERYAYYKRHAAKGELAVNIEKLSARDLVWTVGSRVPESELEWSLHKMHLQQRTWGTAYNMVVYDMERAVKGTSKYDGYTLSEILKKGGICGDRAYFSANTARAAGIPASEISGDGSRGGHAWISWMSAENQWKFSGRYAGYPLGHTHNPQTGKSESEQELVRRSDRSAASDAGMVRGLRPVWLAQALEAAGAVDIAALIFEGASTLADKVPAVWQAKLAFWASHKAEAPVDQWHLFVDALKRNMKEDPDMLAEARAAEEKFVFPRQDSTLAMTDLKKDARRIEMVKGKTNVDQADQVAKVIKQEAEELQKTGKLEPIRFLYEKGYREHGKNPAVFKKLMGDCWGFLKNDPDIARKACRDMELFFRRSVNSGGDYFDVSSQMSALKVISKCYRDIGEDKKADTLAKDVAKASQMAAKRAL